MTDSANLAVVRRFYGDHSPATLQQVLSPAVCWDIVPGFPHGGVHRGLEAILRDFLGRLRQDFEDWRTDLSELCDAGDRVLALGTYSGRAKRTGKTFTASFTHLWSLQDGVLVHLQQCADTAQLTRALED